MSWKPTEYLLEGELDNTTSGKVTGWMRFAGMEEKVIFELRGDFLADIRGAKIRLIGDPTLAREDDPEAAAYMVGFSPLQTGRAGHITAGLSPYPLGQMPYIEWYGQDGRVAMDLDEEQVVVLGTHTTPTGGAALNSEKVGEIVERGEHESEQIEHN